MTLDEPTRKALDQARAILARRPGLAAARAVLEGVESGRLAVALVGRVSAGKSTLANALLGASRAPTGAQELTFHVTWIRHGPRPGLTIHFRDHRPPRPDDVESLARHVQRSDATAGGIDYLEVTDPAPYLRSFDLVDTPGLDSVSGVESTDTLRVLGERIDAAVLVVSSRGLHVNELEMLADFRGHPLHPGPINAIIALTKVEQLWDPRTRRDPRAVGREVAAQMMSLPAVRGLVHEVYPVASLAAAACATLTEEELADLRALSGISPAALIHWVRGPEAFAAPGPVETGVPAERRAALWSAFSAYGLLLACDIVREGVADVATLRAEMDERSGIDHLRRTLAERFGARAELIKLNHVHSLVQSLPSKFAAGRSPGEVAILRDAAKKFTAHALTHVPRFRELEVLRAHYDGRTELAEDDAAELLRVLGEAGADVRARLGLPPDAPIAEVRAQAHVGMDHCRDRYASGGTSGATRDATGVLMRAFERIVDTVDDIRWEGHVT